MFSRKNGDERGKVFPDVWTGKFEDLIGRTYGDKLNQEEKDQYLLAEFYADEVVLLICLIARNNINAIPITFILSSDLDSKQAPEKILETLVNSSGQLLDAYFDRDQDAPMEEIYQPRWTQLKENPPTFFRCTRENLPLTLEADRLLNEH